MKIKYLCALLLAALIYSCDDSTTGIGMIIPGGDKIRQIQTVMSLPPNLCWPTPFMHVPVLHI